MIYIENLTKIFPTGAGDIKALDGVTLHIEKGEVFG